MALIRGSSNGAVAEAMPLDLGDLRRQGALLVESAQAEAARVLEEAHAERERLLSDAREVGRAEGQAAGFEKGLAEGRAKGEAAAREQVAAQLATLDRAWCEALGAFERERAALLHEAREDVLRLALRIARRVIGREVDADERVAVEQVRAALEQLSRATSVLVQIHPDDEAVVRKALPELAALHPQLEHAQLSPEAGIDRGGCVVTTPEGGAIDARIETQVQRIADLLVPSAGERGAAA